MLPQEIAVEKIMESLKKDPFVKAVFLKGSMGRNEHDAHSDIDLYCLVEKENEKVFLLNRKTHLEAYRPIIFEDDIFIIAPQLIAVFDDLLHMDLFTVTVESYTKKDYFKVLYDPEGLMNVFTESQTLKLNGQEFNDAVIDVAWFLFQYKKAASRGNDIWAARMLTNSMEHLAKVLLYKYKPERAQLGLKTLETSLPKEILQKLELILESITPRRHREAVIRMCELLNHELDWMTRRLTDGVQIENLLRKMVELHLKVENRI